MTNTMTGRTSIFTKTVTKVRTFLSGMFMEVYADAEPNPTTTTPEPQGTTPPANTPPANPAPTGTVPFEQLIANARAEEKNKLYPQIEEYKKKSNDYLLVIAERDKTITELTSKVTKLETENASLKESAKNGKANDSVNAELSAKLTTAEQALATLQAKYDTDVAQMKVDAYRKEKIAGANGAIIPELVTGSTNEEIDASFTVAQQRYNEIAYKAVGNVHVPPANPISDVMHNQLGAVTTQDLSTMSLDDYAKQREALGMKPIGKL